MRSVAAAACLLIACSQSVRGQTPGPPARLLGVFDGQSGEPITGVQVQDAFSGSYALTGVGGTVRLSYLTFRGDAALVRLMKLGYDPKNIVLARGDTTPITEILARVATLAPMVTTERYRVDRDDGRWEGFDRRCQEHTTTCFSDSLLATKVSSNMADVLIKARGITIGACGSDRSRNTQCGRASMHSSVIPPAYCEPSIFVDGYWWNPHVGGAVDMQPNTPPAAPFTPANVKGVEVYETNAPRPMRFEGDPFCGAIVIWTK